MNRLHFPNQEQQKRQALILELNFFPIFRKPLENEDHILLLRQQVVRETILLVEPQIQTIQVILEILILIALLRLWKVVEMLVVRLELLQLVLITQRWLYVNFPIQELMLGIN